ncbi:alpha/beta hydrolase family protein [Methylomarinum vadi]|uniref:alpha/beta hydrolase family protein n=1 Tax=Methylomarinum vadi TaxID=438855 RepID=UPI0004DF923C|nr:alpha/beta family hydrolase [Methylomarinum vadi]
MKTETHKITVNPKAYVTSIWLIPEQFDSILLIAPGAGKDMHSDFISHLHEGIAEYNIMTVKFNFPYLEQGRAAPNTPSVLEDTWLAVIDAVMAQTGFPREKIFLSGKSMGGRYATLLAAKMDGFAGIILYSYPLHAPGKTHKPRSEDLNSVHSPMVFFQGSRDSLCELDVFRPILDNLPTQPELNVIEGGDHSFKMLKRLNRSDASIRQELVEKSVEWIKRHQ